MKFGMGITFGLLVFMAGCHRRIPVAALPPSPAPAAALAPLSAPSAAILDEADRSFLSGNYDRAVERYSDYLRLAPTGNQRDRIFFQLGVIYALPDYPQHDWKLAATYLKQVASRQPMAQIILTLHDQIDQLTAGDEERDQRIKQLTGELDRLKKIDADRLKRP